jgi:DNA-binding PadR family transcriptional regulator
MPSDSLKPLDIRDHRQLYSGLIRLHVLHHAAQEKIFGLGLIDHLSQRGYKLSPGMLYPLLHDLERRGFLSSEEQIHSGKIRRLYQATPAGRSALKAAKLKVHELFGDLLQHETEERAPRRQRQSVGRRSKTNPVFAVAS